MKIKIKVLSGALPPISSQNFQSEDKSTSIAIYTTAHARSLTKMAVEKLRLKLSLLFSCCLTKRIQPILPIRLGESASWGIGKYEKGVCAAATQVFTLQF